MNMLYFHIRRFWTETVPGIFSKKDKKGGKKDEL